jgi:hypothetical protein
MKRLEYILTEEKVSFNTPVLAELIMKYIPDWRRVINECQRYGMSGSIDSGILVTLSESSIKGLMKDLKNKNFKGMRKWVTDNIDLEATVMFRMVYDNMIEYISPDYIPQLVITLAEYQYKNAFVADHELNTVACLTEIMAQGKFN